jgi:hypothetical protein
MHRKPGIVNTDHPASGGLIAITLAGACKTGARRMRRAGFAMDRQTPGFLRDAGSQERRKFCPLDLTHKHDSPGLTSALTAGINSISSAQRPG